MFMPKSFDCKLGFGNKAGSFMLYTRLLVFLAVARHLSFTKASRQLCISQPAITKHIAALESYYNVSLFDRKGSSISLSAAGELLLSHARKIKKDFTELDFAMHLLNQNYTGSIRVGASTTIAQYVLPKPLAAFCEHYTGLEISLVNDNSDNIQKALLNHEIDVGLVENATRSVDLDYEPFLDDELVIVASGLAHIDKEIDLESFKRMPLILREYGSGTLEVIESVLNEHNIKLGDLNVRMHMGSTEAIKLFLQNSSCLGIVSIYSIARELIDRSLKIIDLENITFRRKFSFVTNRGAHLDYIDKFTDFVKENIAL